MAQADLLPDKTTVTGFLDVLQTVLIFLFSWVVLLGISVIVTGKIAARHFSMGIDLSDEFKINIYIINIKARGDEVSLGFLIFSVFLFLTILIGGADAYAFFRSRSGIDIGHWNSLCMVASFLSLIFSACLIIYFRVSSHGPIISPADRKELMEQIKNTIDQADDDKEVAANPIAVDKPADASEGHADGR